MGGSMRDISQEAEEVTMPDDIGAPFAFDGGQRVAANPQDKWVSTGSDHIAVVTSPGDVFVHMVSANFIEAPFQLATATPVGANAEDRFLFNLDTRIVVVTRTGRVFVHDLQRAPQPPDSFLQGAPIAVSAPREITGGVFVAANPQDRHVLFSQGRLLVITADGSVFAHTLDLQSEKIGVPFQLSSPSKVAANPQDEHVLAWDDKILVVTADGSVFAHTLSNDAVGAPFQLSPPDIKVAARPEDKNVLPLPLDPQFSQNVLPFPGGGFSPSTLMVITNSGSVFGHNLFSPPPPH
jgi:hypothetical protein